MAISLTVDIVVFTFEDSALKVLLVRRRNAPHRGRMALPGGFVKEKENLEQAALRELREETGLHHVSPEQLCSFGDPRRDPRGRVVSIAYLALVAPGRPLHAGSDASEAAWLPLNKLPALAFDHRQMVRCALQRLRNKLDYSTAGFQLLPRKFSLPELQTLYETVLDRELDKRNFRKKMDLLGILKRLKEWRRTGRKPARLYTFIPKKFERLKDKGILFPF
ncbi:MAG TPA: NUDIX domain-containing protein [Candidatus Angelobacter sp.]|nr:NUDIX domain-containing protein [Candidatus Angelobacter sp.]